MSANTTIEWCDHTFNPWIGCTKVDELCTNCYAEGEDNRRGWTPEGWGKGKPRYRTSEANWRGPVKWNRKAEQSGTRPRVFCASLADWLDDEVPIGWLIDLLDLIEITPHLDWLLLTKRPENWESRLSAVQTSLDLCGGWLGGGVIPENIWIGTSVGNQSGADVRIPALLAIPAKIRFLSCEPLLGPVDLGLLGAPGDPDWVICGGESGPHARPMHPDWARSLRDQCAAASVPFLFKQWGEWLPANQKECPCGPQYHWALIDGIRRREFRKGDLPFCRIGKKAAGRVLDGREWNEFPTEATT